MKKKLLTAMYIILVAAVAMLIVREFDLSADIFGSERQTKYTLYIGMNDKDTNQQTYGMNEAKQVMFMIVQKYTGGCTFYEAEGCWYDEAKKIMLSENTLVCVLLDTKPEAVKSIMDEAIKTFRQSSILLETEEVRGAFYSN
ncbi:MAG: DUF3574 domain-containing protein [Synergistaceae bacterium]|nr:DUF3574 domain-containing protein [Synergistaceae bacterium]